MILEIGEAGSLSCCQYVVSFATCSVSGLFVSASSPAQCHTAASRPIKSENVVLGLPPRRLAGMFDCLQEENPLSFTPLSDLAPRPSP